MSDVCSYWSQTTLLLAFGIERYILICKGTQAETLLNTRNRILFYIATILCSFAIPLWVLLHHYMLGGSADVSNPRLRCALEIVLVQNISSTDLTFLRLKVEVLDGVTSALESDHEQPRAQLGLIINGFERRIVKNSDQREFRAQLDICPHLT